MDTTGSIYLTDEDRDEILKLVGILEDLDPLVAVTWEWLPGGAFRVTEITAGDPRTERTHEDLDKFRDYVYDAEDPAPQETYAGPRAEND